MLSPPLTPTGLRAAPRTPSLRGLALVLLLACAGVAPSHADGVPTRGEPGASRRPAPRPVSAVRVLAWRSHAICPTPTPVRGARSIDSLREWREAFGNDEAGAIGRRVLWSREKALVYAGGTKAMTAKAGSGSPGTKSRPPSGANPGWPIEPAAALLRLNAGVLWWPVTRRAPDSPPSRVPGGETEAQADLAGPASNGLEPHQERRARATIPASIAPTPTPATTTTGKAGAARPCLVMLVNRAQWHTIRVVEKGR